MIDVASLITYLHQRLSIEFTQPLFLTRDVLWSEIRDDRRDIVYLGVDRLTPLSYYATQKVFNAETQQFDVHYQNSFRIEMRIDYYVNSLVSVSTVSQINAFINTLTYQEVNFPLALQFIGTVKNITTPDFLESYIRQRYQWPLFYNATDTGLLSPVNRVKEIQGNTIEQRSGISGDFKITLTP